MIRTERLSLVPVEESGFQNNEYKLDLVHFTSSRST